MKKNETNTNETTMNETNLKELIAQARQKEKEYKAQKRATPQKSTRSNSCEANIDAALKVFKSANFEVSSAISEEGVLTFVITKGDARIEFDAKPVTLCSVQISDQKYSFYMNCRAFEKNAVHIVHLTNK